MNCSGITLSSEELLKRLKSKFNYINILNIDEYKNYTTKLNFKCNKCNLNINKTFRNLLNTGCLNCKEKIKKNIIRVQYPENRKLKWIDKCKKLHPNLFDYSKVNYINNTTPIILKCNKCTNDFNIIPKILIKKDNHCIGCQDCNIKQSILNRCISSEEIKNKITNKWIVNDWSKYTKQDDILIANCKICNYENKQIAKQLIKAGCIKCYNKRRGDTCKLTLNNLINKFNNKWNYTYDYSKVNYINKFYPIIVICKTHGDYEVIPHAHEKGNGCPKCFPTTEKKLYESLKKYYPTIIMQFKLESCKNKIHLPFDYCIPEIKTIVELDGGQHFRDIEYFKNRYKFQIERDIYKMNKAHQEGYKIIRVTQDDIYKYNEKWIIDNLLPEINNNDRKHIFISSDDTIYDKHIELFEKS